MAVAMSAAMESYKQIFTLPPGDEGEIGIFKNIGLFVQETSNEHSTRMGISITALQAANLTWVLARQQFLLFKMPKPGEKIEIETNLENLFYKKIKENKYLKQITFDGLELNHNNYFSPKLYSAHYSELKPLEKRVKRREK